MAIKYQVVEVVGSAEPWWFSDDWQDDIVSVHEFDKFYQALKYYKKDLIRMGATFPKYSSCANFLSTFWNESEEAWCEACGDFAQQYHSLTLLEDWNLVENYEARKPYHKTNDTYIPFEDVCDLDFCKKEEE